MITIIQSRIKSVYIILVFKYVYSFNQIRFNQNYGVFGILDYLHGTNKIFTTTQAFKRHYIMTDTVPVKEKFPDLPTEKSS